MSAFTSEDLRLLWDAASSRPFHPFLSKDLQFSIAIILLSIAFLLSGIFALNRSVATLTILGIPASIAFGFGAVYMICAVGVYV